MPTRFRYTKLAAFTLWQKLLEAARFTLRDTWHFQRPLSDVPPLFQVQKCREVREKSPKLATCQIRVIRVREFGCERALDPLAAAGPQIAGRRPIAIIFRWKHPEIPMIHHSMPRNWFEFWLWAAIESLLVPAQVRPLRAYQITCLHASRAPHRSAAPQSHTQNTPHMFLYWHSSLVCAGISEFARRLLSTLTTVTESHVTVRWLIEVSKSSIPAVPHRHTHAVIRTRDICVQHSSWRTTQNCDKCKTSTFFVCVVFWIPVWCV